jgi:hypothetical protein
MEVGYGDGTAPRQEDLMDWANMADMATIPVLQNDSGASWEPWIQYEYDMAIPTTVQLGPNMEVLCVDQGCPVDPGSYL